MRALLFKAILFCVTVAAVAACSNGQSVLTGGNSRPVATPTVLVTPSPTPTATIASSTSSISVNGGMALSNQPTTVPVPMPSGYAQSIQIPLVSAPAGTSVAVVSGSSVPPGLVPLARSRNRLPLGLGRFATSSSYDTIFYESFEPSANVTVAGDVSADQTFPAGMLSASTSYYLAFYDTASSTPAWQTIAGPVSPSVNTLTFSGTISSTTLAAGTLYGFAIFSTTAPTATPPPAPQALLYFGNQSGLTVAGESGTVISSLDIPSISFDLDDAGNVYAVNAPYANGQLGAATLTKYPNGSASPSATYAPSSTVLGFVAASGAGQVAFFHNLATSATMVATDVWGAGVTGAPSYTITTTPFGQIPFFGAAHDGTIYLSDTSSMGAPQIDVFAPGSSTPTSIIPETIITPANYQYYSPNYAAVGPDGTLYVTQYTLQQPDPIAGTYIYKPNGTEQFIQAAANAGGPGPTGVDVDGSGNIYVVNDNLNYTQNGCVDDTLGTVSEYNSSGTLVQTDTGALGTAPITTTADGTNFLSSFNFCSQQVANSTPNPGSGIYSILPGATTSTQINPNGSTEIVVYNGNQKTAPFARSKSGAGGSGGFGRAYRRIHFPRH